MKMDLFRTALLLLASMVAVAQQDQSSQQPPTSPPSEQTTTAVGGATDEDQPVFRGCLSGTQDNYTLNDQSSGKTYRLHSDKDIKEHVGNLVEIRGTVKKEGEDRSETATAGQQEIDVADIKTVSSGCESAAATQPSAPQDSSDVASAQQGAVGDESAAALPQTASPLPLVALLGLVSLAAGFAGFRRR